MIQGGQQQQMTCENYPCATNIGRDYIRKVKVPNWHNEPIFLCAEHSKGFELVGEEKFLKELLPDTYTITKNINGYHCVSERGIVDVNGDEGELWANILQSIKNFFIHHFQEVFHNTSALHKDFTIYLKRQ